MRKINRRSAEKSIAVIIDGKDEKWYLETVKEHYPNVAMKKATIKPDLPQKKSVEALFALAQQKLAMESTQVILILDMDSIIKNSQEFERFRVYYEKYLKSTQGTLTPREKAKYGWMNSLVIIVNTPCLEFWYLLHFSKTHKFFPDFSAMEATLRKQPGLEEYDKSEDYYKKSPNIYDRLGGEEGIRMARNNAMPFSLAETKSTGISEMNKFFEIFEK
mgnify:FL=1